mmetsp:Transcript_5500/g.9080  ORF Transcript_5500/g.9080 Transcript_5500/m.9080 type:complete len:155 (-) Transcript_5500:66-530(-)|eukprot:CAMPEP_0119021576 /NCGR_PEP_ID=MMETSP1176-20130426/26254_1 /TAXON_ID=265551 /ORGANISM="Synedropsis recta cf, Strain CCMP1620" /LENGTH=154 /DNA_ID=CAMNT_0006976207 /DNA_START=135 /DNA_END=595 /DNA_ORIENTATION=+
MSIKEHGRHRFATSTTSTVHITDTYFNAGNANDHSAASASLSPNKQEGSHDPTNPNLLQDEHETKRDKAPIGSPQKNEKCNHNNAEEHQQLSPEEIFSAQKRRASFLQEPFVMEMTSYETEYLGAGAEAKVVAGVDDGNDVDSLLGDLIDSLRP